ncbi:uncharacterized protein CXorf49-like [Lepus europaeus]|uniref:uncharacterized protein CXorf49-like n=1 Tax=Lepus europaeus TaxID=9983 RepID=UPI002B481E2C|nr:uncharacterized protein CXorf49-like [Lepus europaeus]
MSSHSKASGFSEAIGLKSEQAVRGSSGAPRAPGQSWDLGLPESGEGREQDQGEGRGESGPSSPQTFNLPLELDSDSEPELRMIQEGEGVPPGCEARPTTPASDGEGPVDSMSQVAEACAAIVRLLSDPEAGALRRFPYAESTCAETGAVCVHFEAEQSSKATLDPSSVETLQACAAPPYMSASGTGQIWDSRKRRVDRPHLSISMIVQRACRDGLVGLPFRLTSSDDLGIIQPRRVSIPQERRGLFKCSSSETLVGSPRDSVFLSRENFPHISVRLLTSTLWGFTWTMERRRVQEMASIISKKMQSVVSIDGEGRPSCPGAGAAAASGAGGLPHATPKKELAQKQKSLGIDTKVVIGTAFAPWGHRESIAPMASVSFPKVSLPEKPSTVSLLHGGSKKSNQGCARKKRGTRRKRDFQAVVRGDGGLSRDPVPKTQLPAHMPGTPSQSSHRGEFSSGNPNTRDHPAGTNCQPLSPSRGAIIPRSPALSGELEPPVLPRRSERQQLPPGIEGCPQCVILQKEIDDLRKECERDGSPYLARITDMSFISEILAWYCCWDAISNVVSLLEALPGQENHPTILTLREETCPSALKAADEEKVNPVVALSMGLLP